MRQILANNNHNFPDQEYNLIFEITLKNYPNSSDMVSYKAFIDVMRNLKREFMKYRNLLS